jgi:hypothetical protein
MFGLFKTPPFRDSLLGEFAHSRGHWRGAIALDGATNVPLVLSGRRSGPDELAVVMARSLPDAFASWRPTIEAELFEHFSPYAEAVAAGQLPVAAEQFPIISTPSQVWPHVSLVFASVTPLDGELTFEVGYTTAWDIEHMLGARFRTSKFLELCGSIVPP